MDAIVEIATKHNLLVVEDAAQAVDAYYIKDVLSAELVISPLSRSMKQRM